MLARQYELVPALEKEDPDPIIFRFAQGGERVGKKPCPQVDFDRLRVVVLNVVRELVAHLYFEMMALGFLLATGPAGSLAEPFSSTSAQASSSFKIPSLIPIKSQRRPSFLS